ncbi:retropepsin-like aspartic protease [Paraburkholderia phytofirmans]|nr:retropepsin-like aspartic protease [Paraburkholderia phytofirmans]
MNRLLGIALMTVTLGACSRHNEPVAVVPLEPGGMAPVLTVNIGANRYQFVFDTGATTNLIDPRIAARHLGRMSEEQMRQWERYQEPLPRSTSLLGGAAAAIQYYRASSVRYGGWTIPSSGLIPAVDAPELTRLSQSAGTPLDGVLGMRSIAALNWIWDRHAGRLEGYRFGSKNFAPLLHDMACTAISIQPNGLPAITLDLPPWGATWFVIDTGFVTNYSGSLSIADVAVLRHMKALSGEVTASNGQSADPATRESDTFVQVGAARLEHLTFDRLVFEQIALSSARLGMGFINRFERVAFDFEANRFCFAPPIRTMPDTLPTRAELAAPAVRE